MRNQEKVPFFHAAMKVIHHTEGVLTFHQVSWQRGPAMDFDPYINAMLRLCELQQLDNRPVEHLRCIKAVVSKLRGSVAVGELKQGEENAAKYEQWLVSSFPEAFNQMRKQATERVQRHALN